MVGSDVAVAIRIFGVALHRQIQLPGGPSSAGKSDRPSARAVLLFRRAAFMVLAIYAVRTTGALGDAHSVLGLGFATGAGLSGRYPVRILLGGSGFARIRVVSS